MNDETLVSYLLGELPAEEATRVQAWLMEDEAHATYFNQFKTIWEKSLELAATSTRTCCVASPSRRRKDIRKSGV